VIQSIKLKLIVLPSVDGDIKERWNLKKVETQAGAGFVNIVTKNFELLFPC